MWETKCSICDKMIPANKCPQIGYFEPGKGWKNSFCKPCWISKNAKV